MFLDFDFEGVELGLTQILQASVPATNDDVNEIISQTESQIKTTTESLSDFMLPLDL